MWWIAITGYSKGRPERLVAAYDPDSNMYLNINRKGLWFRLP